MSSHFKALQASPGRGGTWTPFVDFTVNDSLTVTVRDEPFKIEHRTWVIEHFDAQASSALTPATGRDIPWIYGRTYT